MTDDYRIIDCPKCKATGKKLQWWTGMGIANSGEQMYTQTSTDCTSCSGLGKLKVKVEDFREYKGESI